MIQIESVQIAEVRGIRELVLNMNRENFVISGPNGSGKSGIVDAIEFALTGEIHRLTGKGTAGLTVAAHGPHVDKRDYPDASFVTLKLRISQLKKSITVTRRIKQSRKLAIKPNDTGAKAVLVEIAQHPEITLSRREIIKFILAEATKRSQEVQTLLKLDQIDQIRATLKTTQNRLDAKHASATSQVDDHQDALRRLLDVPKLTSEDLLAAINERRRLLGFPNIKELAPDSSLSEGVSGAKEGTTKINKEAALRDLNALRDSVAKGLSSPCSDQLASTLANLAKLEDDTGLLEAIRRRSFVQTGLDLTDTSQCPLCDKNWEDVEILRAHLQSKIDKSKKAEQLQNEILRDAAAVASQVGRIRALAEPVQKLAAAESEDDFAAALAAWTANLNKFSNKLSSIDNLLSVKPRLTDRWTEEPGGLLSNIGVLTEKVKAHPDETAADNARSFLILAQERLTNYQRARHTENAAKQAAQVGKVAYKTYCRVAEAALLGLYKEVEEDFCTYYRYLNQDDEGEFKARLAPSEGKLDLSVDFYKRGMFPPGAYHSEGHQDGMGVCLYLALMKRLLGGNFTLAVLDDVVMSVDSGHRRRFCRLLKTYFPNTQFIVTTHDQVWARQMRTEGLVSSKSSVAFHGWTAETGPIVEEGSEVWEQINEDLAKNEVPTAAGRLRRHLEYISGELADRLGAKVPYKGDSNYDLGDLLPAVIGRQGELLRLAAKAAQSWDDQEAQGNVNELKATRSASVSKFGGEQWIINKAIHFNDWTNFSKEDFNPVVKVFNKLLLQFRCEHCDSWFHVAPQKDPEQLRCDCARISLNLKSK